MLPPGSSKASETRSPSKFSFLFAICYRAAIGQNARDIGSVCALDATVAKEVKYEVFGDTVSAILRFQARDRRDACGNTVVHGPYIDRYQCVLVLAFVGECNRALSSPRPDGGRKPDFAHRRSKRSCRSSPLMPAKTWIGESQSFDLMKLLKLDSGLGARKQLAQELGYTSTLDGSAEYATSGCTSK